MAKKTPRKFTDLEMRIMQGFWDLGLSPIREIQETWPEKGRPAYTTVQTIVYRLEQKGAVRRKKKIGNAHIFEPLVTCEEAMSRTLDEVIERCGGSATKLVEMLLNSGRFGLTKSYRFMTRPRFISRTLFGETRRGCSGWPPGSVAALSLTAQIML